MLLVTLVWVWFQNSSLPLFTYLFINLFFFPSDLERSFFYSTNFSKKLNLFKFEWSYPQRTGLREPINRNGEEEGSLSWGREHSLFQKCVPKRRTPLCSGSQNRTWFLIELPGWWDTRQVGRRRTDDMYSILLLGKYSHKKGVIAMCGSTFP